MNTVYAIAIAFSSWDACWDYYHEQLKHVQDNIDHVYMICSSLEVPKELAPRKSLRPKMRPDDLMKKHGR